MALNKCKQCKKQTSRKTSKCSNCENNTSAKNGENTTKVWPFLLLILFCCTAVLVSEEHSKPQIELTAEEQTKRDRADKVSQSFSVWDGSHIALKRLVKAAMNDPDSFEHIDTRYIDHGETLFVVMEFRGRNAYRGMIKQTVRANVDVDTGEVIEIVSQD